MKEVPEHEELFVVRDAIVRTEQRCGGRLRIEECKVLGGYGRDALNDNGERLLSVSSNHGLAVKYVLSTAKIATLHTFNGRSKKCI